MSLVLAAFLTAHGLIHLSYLTPAPPQTADGPAWPFHLDESWVSATLDLDPTLVRAVGGLLVAASVGLFVASALATLDWLPASWWSALVIGAASTSLVTLALFFHPWLVLGMVIDVILLLAVVVVGWAPSAVLEP
jgi:hypothetical protein